MGTKQVIILRKDLNMRKGKMVAQGAHASLQVILEAKNPMPQAMAAWCSKCGGAKIVVGVDSEQELLDLYDQAKQGNFPCSIILDEGRTEFHNVPTYTAVAIGPESSDRIDTITGHLKLL